MQKFKITYACSVCGNQWRKIVTDLEAPDPPCPNLACRAEQRNVGMDYTSNRAPAAVGMSHRTKAVDETARMVMEDYKLTDLRDDVRQGETMAPKLPPKLQNQADNFFNRKARKALLPNAGQIGRAALAGAYAPGRAQAPDPINVVQEPRKRVPVRIINRE